MKLMSGIQFISVIIIAVVFVSSCGNRYRVKSIMNEFIKEEILIPDNLYVVANKIYDKVDLQKLDGTKLIVYIDSLSCGACRIAHFVEMLPLYEKAEEDGRFTIMAIFSPKSDDLPDIERQLMLLDFPYPIYVDSFGDFARSNAIPKDSRFHDFLIDRDGKVLFVGNPLANNQLKSVFMNALQNINN